MNICNIIGICAGASAGALLRWCLGLQLNHLFPTLPLGTLSANLLGGFLIGIMMAILQANAALPETVRLMIITGFLGGLTTFSTFSAETIYLLSHQEYLWALCLSLLHVLGSLCATLAGIYSIKILTS